MVMKWHLVVDAPSAVIARDMVTDNIDVNEADYSDMDIVVERGVS